MALQFDINDTTMDFETRNCKMDHRTFRRGQDHILNDICSTCYATISRTSGVAMRVWIWGTDEPVYMTFCASCCKEAHWSYYVIFQREFNETDEFIVPQASFWLKRRTLSFLDNYVEGKFSRRCMNLIHLLELSNIEEHRFSGNRNKGLPYHSKRFEEIPGLCALCSTYDLNPETARTCVICGAMFCKNCNDTFESRTYVCMCCGTDAIRFIGLWSLLNYDTVNEKAKTLFNNFRIRKRRRELPLHKIDIKGLVDL